MKKIDDKKNKDFFEQLYKELRLKFGEEYAQHWLMKQMRKEKGNETVDQLRSKLKNLLSKYENN